MTNPLDNLDRAPKLRALVFILIFVALGLAFMVAVYALTPASERPALLTRVGTVLPGMIVIVPTVLAWLNGRDAKVSAEKAQHAAQEAAENVNGRMTQLIDKLPDLPVAERTDR